MNSPHTCSIYLLYGTDGKPMYVGRTSRPIEVRLNDHRHRFGFKPKHEILATCSENCREIEKRWIIKFRDEGHKLLNIYWGQGPHFLSESTRAKIRRAFLGRKVTWAEKISATQKGVPKNWSPEGRKRVQATQLKKGHDFYRTLSSEAKERHRRSSKKVWESISLEERSKLATQRNLSAWAKRTPEQRAAIWAKAVATRRARGSY